MKKTELSVKIGKRIRELRHENNLSQEQLALMSNIHRTYLGNCERGEKNITIQTLSKICTTLNISLYAFFYKIDI